MTHPNQPPPHGVPAAFAANGQHQPPSPEAILAFHIGEAVGQKLAALLPQALAQVSSLPACVLCVADRKQAETAAAPVLAGGDQEAAMAAAAGLPQVRTSVTWMPLGPAAQQTPLPVCYQHFQVGPTVRSTGLVDAAGNEILARGTAPAA